MELLKIIRAFADEDDTYASLEYGDDENRKWLHKVVEENPIASSEELAWFCDRGAEGRNAHEFVGVHILLAGLLIKLYGRNVANRVMLHIARRGGLDGMNGVCGFDEYDSCAEFGLISGRDQGPGFRFGQSKGQPQGGFGDEPIGGDGEPPE